MTFSATNFTYSGNTTDITNFDNSSIENLKSSDKLTEYLSLGIQATMAFIGFIGNSLTFITLNKNGQIFAPSVLKLIKNQAILDAIVCLLGSVYVLQSPMWKTHWSEKFDIFICHVSIIFTLMMYNKNGTQCRVLYCVSFVICINSNNK